MLGSIFNNQVIRKVTTSFASLFTNLTIVRLNTNGTEQQRLMVPLMYSDKEKFIKMLEDDPELNRPVQITLPRMSYAFMGMEYDAKRKENTVIQNFALGSNQTLSTQYNPVAYNLNYELYIYVRTNEDGNQIVEQILPFFEPSYTLRINLISSMNITKDVPIVLNSVTYENVSEGNEDDPFTRIIIWTLSFTARAYIYGPISTSGLIKEAIISLNNYNLDPTLVNSDQYTYLVMSNNDSGGNTDFGSYLAGETVYQGPTLAYATATAEVVAWSDVTSYLQITNPTGTFVTNVPIIGNQSGANFTLINYLVNTGPLEIITVTPNPINANSTNLVGYIVTIDDPFVS